MPGKESRRPPHTLPVDEVDPELVGAVEILRMKRFAEKRKYAFACDVFLLLLSGQPDEVLLRDRLEAPLPWLVTHQRWSNIVEAYSASGILKYHSCIAEAERTGYLLSASRVFGVEKGFSTEIQLKERERLDEHLRSHQ